MYIFFSILGAVFLFIITGPTILNHIEKKAKTKKIERQRSRIRDLYGR